MRIIKTTAHFVPATTTYEFDLSDPNVMDQIRAMFEEREILDPINDPDFDERD